MFLRLITPLVLLVCCSQPLIAQPASSPPLEDEALGWLQEFIRIDTVNPPGNESRAVDFLGTILEAEGIAWQSAESAPGRGNLWARLEGGDLPALLLLQHTDVVPADPEYWTADPLGGEIRDGYLWGRGALDMKGTGISQLAAFIALHRSMRALNRDVILLATADEEAGGFFGAGWMLEHHPGLFENVGFVLNEGGGGVDQQGRLLFNVEVTQKVPVWLRLKAVDTPGHGSMPRQTSSVSRIVDALARLNGTEFAPRIVPAVDEYFSKLAADVGDEWQQAYRDMAKAVREPGFLARLQAESPFLHALTRDTCSLTRMQGSSKINVVPPEAWAEIDCRILPDRPAEVFVQEIRKRLEGSGVEVEVLMAFTPAVTSTDNEVYRAIEQVMSGRYPDSSVRPSVMTGFTDSHFMRDAGIAAYGFDPRVVPESEFARIHGNDERVDVGAWRRGVSDLRAIVETIVYD
ncbi:MAG: M20/M25/M40 family metallo-hydrolase [Xanthomonadales bacterium]|nr:M20/M25/M40 family metallo-hydrolase [Xanthomonadales bacterium]